MTTVSKANTYKGEVSRYRTVDQYKIAGRPYHAGMAAFMLGTGETYGCHFGFKSTYHTSIELYRAGFAMARAIHSGLRS